MNSSMCDCISYNQPEPKQTRPTVVVRPPFGEKSVCLDACIVDAIQSLWAAGIETRGSCCGHGDAAPSVVLSDGATDDIATRARDVLKADGRPWVVLAWRLIPVPDALQQVTRDGVA